MDKIFIPFNHKYKGIYYFYDRNINPNLFDENRILHKEAYFDRIKKNWDELMGEADRIYYEHIQLEKT